MAIGKQRRIYKDPNAFHDEKYLVVISATIVKNKDGDVHRVLSFTVYEGMYGSPLIYTLGMSSGGKWRVVREPEIVANVDFEKFSNRMADLFFNTLNGDLTVEIRYEDQLIQISNDYLRRNRLGRDNKAWAALRDYYLHGDPITRREYTERFKFNAMEPADVGEGYKDGEHTRLDDVGQQFSDEELRQAEDIAETVGKELDKIR